MNVILHKTRDAGQHTHSSDILSLSAEH
jgi:hypothetical protein